MFVYCGNNPVNRVDPSGEEWWHWALGAVIVVGCAAATVVTCGGFAAAGMAVGMVACGSAALTTASTVAATATIGSGLVFVGLAVNAGINSSSVQDFYEQGNWSTIALTGLGGIEGGLTGYFVARQSIPNVSKTTSGYSRPLKNGATPNSRYIQYDQATNKIRTDTIYDANGNWQTRIDYSHTHNINGQDYCPHMHIAPVINEEGFPVGREVVIPWGVK